MHACANHEELACEAVQLFGVVRVLHMHGMQVLRDHVLDKYAHLLTAALPLRLCEAIVHHGHVVLGEHLCMCTYMKTKAHAACNICNLKCRGIAPVASGS